MLILIAVLSQGQDKAVEEMAQAATKFLLTLPVDQQKKAAFDFKDDERLNWHFIPKARKGLPMREMSDASREAALALLRAGLSARGFEKAGHIMSIEKILGEIEGAKAKFQRDPGLYFVSVFGKPGGREVWGWRVEGHHLSVNYTMSDGKIGSAPAFFGANPAKIPAGPKQGMRSLPAEEDLGRELARSLTEEQRKTAVFAEKAPADIITAASRKAKVLEPAGIGAAQLNDPQRETLKKLLEEFVRNHRGEVAEAVLKKINAAWPDKFSFAWAGGLDPGQGHYYRIQGPAFLIEYDNTQNGANHIHSVWRDLDNDFGEDLLKRHYEQDHK